MKKLVDKNGNVIFIKVETSREVFKIPFADVRVNRARAEAIIKAANIQKGSKFLKQSYSEAGYKY